MKSLMFIISSTTLLLLMSILNVSESKTGPAHDKLVVCYISTWAVYRPKAGSFSLDHFDPNLCTHVIYAFAGLDVNKSAIKALDPWQDLLDDYGKGGFEKLTGLKKTHPHLKVSLAIGGWNEGSAKYSNLSANPVRRAQFVKQSVEFIKKYNFDGLDLDWEYPTQREGVPADRENFVHLVRELKNAFRPHNLLLTSAFGASKKVINEAYDVKALASLLDYMHIMCYDYGGSWDKRVGWNSPLTDTTELNVQASIDHFLAMGAPASKIVVGVPFYGRTFVAQGNGYYGDPTDDKGFQGPYTREDGFMGFNEICEAKNNKTDEWTFAWDSPSSQAILRRKNENGTTNVVTYDSSRSIANKMRFIARKNLAGAMIWSVDTDDFLGECTPENSTYADFKIQAGINLTIPKRIYNNFPLLRTVNEALLISVDEIEQEREADKDNEIPKHDDDDVQKDDGGGAGMVSVQKVLFGLVLFVLSLNLF